MKVLIITSSLDSGGKERQLVELVKELYNKKKIVFELAIMYNIIHYSEINNLNIKIHYLSGKVKKDPKIFIQLYKICKKFMPDIIHTWDSMASIYAVPITKKMGIKFINGMIRDAPQKLRPLSKSWLRSKLTFPFSDFVVSNSKAGIRCYKAPLQKSICIHNGFDLTRINITHNKRKIKDKYDINTEKVVGMVASFSNKKDYKTYISSAQVILQERDDVTFVAVGDGMHYEKCKELVHPKFREKIRFLGKQKIVEPIINIFDIGVLATYSEGISNSIMEYMSLGKPVIATEGGGTKELVLNGKTGFLVNTYDVADLSKKVVQLLDNNKLAKKMGIAGQKRIYKNFSVERMTNRYIFLYETILDGKRRYLR